LNELRRVDTPVEQPGETLPEVASRVLGKVARFVVDPGVAVGNA
jgi:hypothetical protein